jgi:D-cysteine desulfhydrase
MRPLLLLRTAEPTRPPRTSANILLDRLAGAEIRWISRADWARRDQLLAEVGDELRAAGSRPYLIPEGGSNALGAWGYVRAVVEELDQELAGSPGPTTVLYACGSGGTGAGLVLGAALCGWRERGIRVAGVNVCDDRDTFVGVIGRICRDFARASGAAIRIQDSDIDIIDGHVGLGYGLSRPEELRTLLDLGRREGLVLDPVYTGKAYFALVEEVTRDRERFGPRIVFLHTGGIFGLFPAEDQIAALL